MAKRGPYRKGPFVIQSGPVELPPPPKRGAKAHNDDRFIALALEGKANGKYPTAKDAARELSNEFSEREGIDKAALYVRLRRKLVAAFNS